MSTDHNKMSANDKLASCIVNKMGKLWEENVLSDLKIIIDDVNFNCHRFHLSACSEVFRVMFQSDAIGFFNDVTNVTIQGIASETLRLILVSVYKGELNVNSENMLDLWHSSHHLQIDFLVNELEYFISRNISDDNVLTIYTLAVELNSVRIMKSVHSFVAKNFDNISRTDDFLHLSFNCLLEVLGHDDLDLKSRDDLVSSVLKWVDFNPRSINRTGKVLKGNDVGLKDQNLQEEQLRGATQERKTTNTIKVVFKSRDVMTYKVESSSQRKDNLGELMKIINLNDVSQDCLLSLLNNDDVMECREARTRVRQAFADRKDKAPVVNERLVTDRSSSVVSMASPESQQCDDLIPVVVYLQTSFKAILAYVLDSRKTYALPRDGLPKDGSIKDVYSYKNNIYIHFIETDIWKDISSIFRFNPKGQWENLTEVPEGSHSFMFTDNYIYCITQCQVCRLNTKYLDKSVWVCVYTLQGTATSFGNFEEKLIISHTTETEIGEPVNISDPRSTSAGAFNFGKPRQTGLFAVPQMMKKNVFMSHITYLSTDTWQSSDDENWISNSKTNFKQIHSYYYPEDNLNINKDDAYLLTEQGLLLQVTNGVDSSLSVTKEENVFSTERKSPPIVGAVRHGKVLFLFMRQVPGLSDPTPLKLTSFDKIKIVPLVTTDSQCVPLKIPKELLKIEV